MKTIIDNPPSKQYKGFVDYFRNAMDQRINQKKNCFNYNIALKHLENFTSGEIPFQHLTSSRLNQLNRYLKTTNGLKCEKPLSANSADTYFKVIVSVVRKAADDRLIDHSVVNFVPVNSRTKSDLNYLTHDELNRLASTPCRVTVLKNAFLFSCLTGLGWREIEALKWRHIQSVEGNWHVRIIEDKIDISVPLNAQAFLLLGTFGKEEHKVFDLHYSAALCSNLNKWAIRAGVYRQITFSTAKISFGMALLNQGIPIELISELLGHKHVKSTIKLLEIEPPIDSPAPPLLASF